MAAPGQRGGPSACRARGSRSRSIAARSASSEHDAWRTAVRTAMTEVLDGGASARTSPSIAPTAARGSCSARPRDAGSAVDHRRRRRRRRASRRRRGLRAPPVLLVGAHLRPRGRAAADPRACWTSSTRARRSTSPASPPSAIRTRSRRCRRTRHEIGHHGHTHRFPCTLDAVEQRDEIADGHARARGGHGCDAAGLPRARLGADHGATLDALGAAGFAYDSSLMGDDARTWSSDGRRSSSCRCTGRSTTPRTSRTRTDPAGLLAVWLRRARRRAARADRHADHHLPSGDPRAARIASMCCARSSTRRPRTRCRA